MKLPPLPGQIVKCRKLHGGEVKFTQDEKEIELDISDIEMNEVDNIIVLELAKIK